MEHVTLSIDGMTCGHCVAAVTQALEAVDGVRTEQVAIGSASVGFDAARSSAEAIARAVSDAGYPAHLAP